MILICHAYEDDKEPAYYYWQDRQWRVSQRFATEDEARRARRSGQLVWEE